MLNDPLADALSVMLNAEKIGRASCIITPVSQMIQDVLAIMHEKNYLGAATLTEHRRGSSLKVELLGKLNNCNAIKPRFSVTKDTYLRFEKRYLPAQGFGHLIISTSQGLMTHDDAKQKKLGGKLICFFY